MFPYSFAIATVVSPLLFSLLLFSLLFDVPSAAAWAVLAALALATVRAYCAWLRACRDPRR